METEPKSEGTTLLENSITFFFFFLNPSLRSPCVKLSSRVIWILFEKHYAGYWYFKMLRKLTTLYQDFTALLHESWSCEMKPMKLAEVRKINFIFWEVVTKLAGVCPQLSTRDPICPVSPPHVSPLMSLPSGCPQVMLTSRRPWHPEVSRGHED